MHLDRLVYILLEPRTCTKPKSKFKFEFRLVIIFDKMGKAEEKYIMVLAILYPAVFL